MALHTPGESHDKFGSFLNVGHILYKTALFFNKKRVPDGTGTDLDHRKGAIFQGRSPPFPVVVPANPRTSFCHISNMAPVLLPRPH